MTPIENFLSRCEAVRPAGANQWEARCKAHNDSRASLSVSQGNDGRVLVNCHAHCSPQAIVDAMGLQMSDLFGTNGNGHSNGHHANGNGKKPQSRFWTSDAAIADLEKRLGPLAGKWEYRDAKNLEVGVVVRFDLADGKTIRPVSRQSDGLWTVEAMREPRPLYELKRLADAEMNIWCEGEKCAAEYQRLGYCATTHSGGANATGKTDWQPLAGKLVIANRDNDAPGAKCLQDVCRRLANLDPPARIKLLELPGLDVGGDIVDFVEMRRLDGKDDAAIKAELDALIERAPEWKPGGESAFDDGPADATGERERDTGAECGDDPEKRYAELLGPIVTNAELFTRAKPPKFLIRNTMTAGTLTVWAAPEKAWKTTLAVHAALVIAGHGRFLGLYEPLLNGPVVFFSGESGDWPLKSMQERILQWVYPCDLSGFEAEPVSLIPAPADVPIFWGGDPPDMGNDDAMLALKSVIQRTGAVAAILDPSQALFCSLAEDMKNDASMRQLMKRLQTLARDTGCAVVLLHHFRQHVQPGFPKRSDSSYGALMKFADTWILANQREAPTGEEDPGTGSLWITWGSRDGFGASHAIDIAEGTHEKGRFFDLQVSDVGPAIRDLTERQVERKERAGQGAREAKTEARKAAILEALAGRVQGATTTAVAATLKTSRQTISPVVQAMLEAGELVRVPAPYTNYRGGKACWTDGLALPKTAPGIIENAKRNGWKPDENTTGARGARGAKSETAGTGNAEGKGWDASNP